MRKVIAGIIILNFLTVTLTGILPYASESAVINHFAGAQNDFTEKIIDLVSGYKLIGNISLGKGIEVYDAQFNISGLPDYNGNYPRYFTIFVSEYTMPTMAFQWAGAGYGALGNQIVFNDELTTKYLDFRDADTDDTIEFRLPKKAQVTSANLKVTGKPNMWAGKNTIDNDENNIGEVHPADMNGDGTVDMVSAGSDKVVWYNNTGGNGSEWDEVPIAGVFTAAMAVYAFDVDSDNDTDVVAASRAGSPGSGHIKYYRNMDGKGTSWQEYTVTESNAPIYECFNIAVADMDNDGDGDIIATSRNYTAPTGPYWFNNTDGNGTAWQKNEISTSYMRSYGLEILDVDSDGDNDTIVTNYYNGQVHWFENIDGKARVWSSPHAINSAITTWMYNIAKGDIDGDGKTDIAVSYPQGIKWYRHPANPKGTWPENYAMGLNSWTHADLAIGDFGCPAVEPDGKPDIVAVSYQYMNSVIVYKNQCTSSENNWEVFSISTDHQDAYNVKTADIDGDNYTDIIACANSISTDEDILWYKLNSSYPSDLKLDIGSDGINDWSYNSGWFDSAVIIDELNDSLNSVLAQKPAIKDTLGIEWVLVELNLSTGTGGRIEFSELDIKYDYSATVRGFEPNNLATIINNKNQAAGSGNISLPVYIYPQLNQGRLKIDDIRIIYNGPPEALPVDEYDIQEDTKVDKLIDLSKYFKDDYLSSSSLSYEVVSYSNDHYVDVFINKLEPHYLGIDAESGTENDDWTGSTAVVVRATDDKGLGVLSDAFVINILPVNDEPVIGSKKLPDININEGSQSAGLDLDFDEYFIDADSGDLYFSYILDPLNEMNESQLNIVLDESSWVLYVEALGDWYTRGEESVRLRIFCDDDPDDITSSRAYQDIFITVNNLDDDAPVWSRIPDMVMKEDEPRYDALNLLSYISDVDNKKSELKFGVEHISDPRLFVEIDSQVNLDISTEKNFFGECWVILNATDGTNYNTTTFEIIIENVNDPPEVQLISPVNELVIYTDSIVLNWSGTDIDPGDKAELMYTIYLDTDSATQPIVTNHKGTTYNVTGLVDKTTFFWKVIPTDGKTAGLCISQPLPYQFSVDLGKKPHSVLTYPDDGLVTNLRALELKWLGYSEDDDELTYDLYVSQTELTVPLPLTGLVAGGITETSWELYALEPGVSYYWTVIPHSIKSPGVCDSGIWSFKYDPTAVPYKLYIEAPEKLRLEKGEFYLEKILIRNDGVNPDTIRPTISAGVAQYLISMNGAGTRHSIAPGEVLTFIINISADKIPVGIYDIRIDVESLSTGEIEGVDISLTVYEEEESGQDRSLAAISMGFLAVIILMIIMFFLILRYKRIQDDKRRVDAEVLKPEREMGILEARDVEYLSRGEFAGAGFTAEPVAEPLTTGTPRYPMLPPTQEEINRFLKDMLDQLDAKFIVGDMSEDTYKELKRKYEFRVRTQDETGIAGEGIDDVEPAEVGQVESTIADYREAKTGETEPAGEENSAAPNKKKKKKKKKKKIRNIETP